jgi:hypothetical protein
LNQAHHQTEGNLRHLHLAPNSRTDEEPPSPRRECWLLRCFPLAVGASFQFR